MGGLCTPPLTTISCEMHLKSFLWGLLCLNAELSAYACGTRRHKRRSSHSCWFPHSLSMGGAFGSISSSVTIFLTLAGTLVAVPCRGFAMPGANSLIWIPHSCISMPLFLTGYHSSYNKCQRSSHRNPPFCIVVDNTNLQVTKTATRNRNTLCIFTLQPQAAY